MAKLPESTTVAACCPACGDPIGLTIGMKMTGPAEVTVTGDDTAIREHVARRHPEVAVAARVAAARAGAA